MKKYICFLLLITANQFAFGQAVLINGGTKNRPLTWNDFTGQPDTQSGHEANTFWAVKYSFQHYGFKGDTINLKGLAVTLELNPAFSWVKPGKETPALLKHEQGHFNIGLICQQEILERINNTVYLKNEFPSRLQNDFNSILHKYQRMNAQYDEETDHSRNLNNQQKWDTYFSEALKKAKPVF